ncbi:MAG: SCO family protein, partial [Verrucomicrobiota bacterium]
LEDLDTSTHAYSVAAAARALRSTPKPESRFAPFVLKALKNVRSHDEPISFDAYDEFPDSLDAPTAVGELMETLRWLGPAARAVHSELGQFQGLSARHRAELDSILDGIAEPEDGESADCCQVDTATPKGSLGWFPKLRCACRGLDDVVFEDQDAQRFTFKQFFHGSPSIVAFFYSRCDNPLKCSLTVTKLAQIQQLLNSSGKRDQIKTAAISYDPEFDRPERLHQYGEDRQFRFGSDHRMLRTIRGFETLRQSFELGVNFSETIVNRHRVELFLLDSCGRIAGSFERIRWENEEVVDRATELLADASEASAAKGWGRSSLARLTGVLGAVALAIYPKCPFCWGAYMSIFGVVGLENLPFLPWLVPVLFGLMIVNLASVWLRSRTTGRMTGFVLVCCGSLLIAGSRVLWPQLAISGVAFTIVGSVLSALDEGAYALLGNFWRRVRTGSRKSSRRSTKVINPGQATNLKSSPGES